MWKVTRTRLRSYDGGHATWAQNRSCAGLRSSRGWSQRSSASGHATGTAVRVVRGRLERFRCRAVSEQDAQALADEIHARKTVSDVKSCTSVRHVGSWPRSSDSMKGRRRWVAIGWIPPTIACQFTAGELAALSVVAFRLASTAGATSPSTASRLWQVSAEQPSATASPRPASSGFLLSRNSGSGPSGATRTW